MPEYRRSFITGGTYFFTVVTYRRLPFLITEEARNILHCALVDVNHRFPFKTDAICLLPDHLHCIWTLPDDDANYSVRWKEIKRLFSKEYINMVGVAEPGNVSREKRGETTFWQRRFWEHVIRDEKDLHQHLDYIHYNPVKHGLAQQVKEWQWSSFKRYVEMGYYDVEWGGGAEKGIPLSCGE
jgi:putative transposase